MEGVKIPILVEPRDFLKNGPTTLKAEAAPAHPVELIQKKYPLASRHSQKLLAANTFGSHVAMRMNMEEAILSQFRRLPALQSSFTGLETLLGMEDEIDFSDYLGTPDLVPPRRFEGSHESTY